MMPPMISLIKQILTSLDQDERFARAALDEDQRWALPADGPDQQKEAK